MDDVKKNFVQEIVESDLEKNGGKLDIVTRFPPEPNGYLHIGHAKAICVDFGIAAEYGGKCNLRMDDTNPAKEDNHYVEAIKRDVEWLGFKWDNLCFAADYFEEMYNQAIVLIKKGLRYERRRNKRKPRHSYGAGQKQSLAEQKR